MSNEHQPGNPGVDLSEIDAAFKVSTLDPRPSAQGRWMTVVAGTWPAIAAELRTLRARVAELEKLFDDAGQGEHNVLALIDHYQSEAMAESEARRAALARVGELECAEADLESQLAAAREEIARVSRLRASGWSVAVHNDYRLGGQPYTFWLFTKGDRCAKGEGASDAEALALVEAAILEVERGS